MSILSKPADRRARMGAAVTALFLLLGGGFVARAVTSSGPPPQPDTREQSVSSAPGPSSPDGSTTPSPAAAPAPSVASADFGPIMAPSPPVALSIPSIGLRTEGLIELNRDKNGKLEAPEDFDRAGWYAQGPTPGEFGPSVIAAHVDSRRGPAVFYRLGSVKKGAEVSVVRKDGSTARFVVDKVARYSKKDFPTATVYGDTKGRAELRLITCGGAIDQTTGHYVDNIVAFAHLLP